MKVIGIDIGSIATKVVLLDAKEVIYRKLLVLSGKSETVACKAIEETLSNNSLSREAIDLIVSTSCTGVDASFADLLKGTYVCLAAGGRALFPKIRTIVDVGAENTAVVTLDSQGRIKDFTSNDKCAAGGGVFLESMAKAMGLSLEEMIAEAMTVEQGIEVTSTCTIFAEQEVLSYTFEEPPPSRAKILAGLHESLASRVAGLSGKAGMLSPVLLCGGLALNIAFVKSFSNLVNVEVCLTEAPQFVAALGAALLGRNYILEKKEKADAGGGN